MGARNEQGEAFIKGRQQGPLAVYMMDHPIDSPK